MSDLSTVLQRHAVSYAWTWVDPDAPERLAEVRIEGRQREPGNPTPIKWAVVLDQNRVLNQDGEWEYEPLPSSRSDEFLARTRWDSAEAALAFVEATLPDWVSTGEMPVVTAVLAQQAARREARMARERP